MQKIGELLAVHSGETAWVFGKGGSLDEFDFAIAGPLRLCINESLIVVPNPSYFFAHDELPIQRVASAWPSNCRAVLQPKRGEFAVGCGIPEEAVFSYEKKDRDLEVLNWTAEKIAERSELLGLTGTVHSALHFCRLIGVQEVKLIGFDGGGSYAASLGLEMPIGGGQHARIRRDSIIVLERLGLEHKFA